MEHRAIDRVAAMAVVAGGALLVFVHYYGGSPGDPEGWFAALGFGAPYIGIGSLALIGIHRDRPALVLMAAAALVPMSVFSIVLVPLLIPAVVLIVGASRGGLDPRELAFSAMLASVLLGALAVLVFHQDPATWSTPTGGGGSSNIITTAEAALAISAALTVNLIAASMHRAAT